MPSEVCTISLGNGVLDNDYIFYADGTIERYYDAHQWSHSNTVPILWNSIKSSDKEKLVQRLPPDILTLVEGKEKDQN